MAEITFRIVLLGKTGSGKSSLANTIFGDKQFKVNHSASSNSKDLWMEFSREVHGRNIQLMDTPGFYDTDPSCSAESSPEFLDRIKEYRPHAFLLVLKLQTFTGLEEKVVNILLKCFSEEVLNYTFLVFTHGDNLPDRTKVTEWVDDNEALKTLVQKCGCRCHVFDNKYWNNSQDPYRNNQHHVRELLNSVQEIVGKNGNEVFRPAPSPEPSEDDSDTYQFPENTRRIILLGKTGAGKSSLANAIFGDGDIFSVNSRQRSKLYQSETKQVGGKNIQLIDTPYFFDTLPCSSELLSEFCSFLTECSPGFHAVLLALKVEKFTPQQQSMAENIQTCFSNEVLKFTTVVFTHGDDLPEEMTIEEWVSENEGLKCLVQKCGGRVHVIDNKRWNDSHDPYRNNQVQIKNLLKSTEEILSKNGGRFYTNEILQELERQIQQAVSEISATSQEDDPQSKRQKAKKIVLEKYQSKIKRASK